MAKLYRIATACTPASSLQASQMATKAGWKPAYACIQRHFATTAKQEAACASQGSSYFALYNREIQQCSGSNSSFKAAPLLGSCMSSVGCDLSASTIHGEQTPHFFSRWYMAAAAAAATAAVGGISYYSFSKGGQSSTAHHATSSMSLQSTFMRNFVPIPVKCDGAPATGSQSLLWRSETNQPLERKLEDALIFCGTSNEPLARSVADRLGTKLGQVFIRRFADGEVFMQFLDSMRGKDVYLIQPTSPPVNDNLIELLLMISTCRRSSARKITAIIPYYGYARQDRKLSSRVPISAADVACMIQAMGVDRVVAVDLHCGQIQGFFGPRVPVDNLEAQIIGLNHFKDEQLHKPIVISPDAGGVYRAKKFQEGLIHKGYVDCGIAMLIKQRIRANEISSVELVGNVSGSDVIIVDDMIDTARTLCEAARVLREHGARRVFAFATHGLFSRNAIQLIEESPLEKVIVTDSIKAREEVEKSSKITILSVSVLVADAIRRIHQKESLTELFKSPKKSEA